MGNHPSDFHRTFMRRIQWVVAAMLPVAAFTASAAPWTWEFPLLCVGTAFLLGLLVRTQNPELERLAHIVVLAGSAPVVVRSFFGDDLPGIGLVHVVAVLLIAVGVGYWSAERIRPRGRKAGAV